MKTINFTNSKKHLVFVLFLLFFTLGAIANPINPPKAFNVFAKYAPDSGYPGSPYAAVYWGVDFVDFEGNSIPNTWLNDNSSFGWVVTTPDVMGYNGSYCLMSGNGGVANSSSSIQVEVTFVEDGSISFIGGCFGEGYGDNAYDACEFYIDDERQFRKGSLQTWEQYSFDVTAGSHVFKWSYTKDGSRDYPVDAFLIDDVIFSGVASITATPKVYNVYRKVAGTQEEELIASDLTGYQYIDEDWFGLEEGDYQYGVENPNSNVAGIFWSDPITKVPVEYFNISVTSDPVGGGTITGAGEYTYKATCTLTATPNPGYYLDSWSHNGTNLYVYDDSYTFTVTEATT